MAGDAPGDNRSDRDVPGGTDGSGTNDRNEERDRIPIDLSGDRDAGSASGDDPDDEPYAPEPGSTPIEPGAPNLENAAFVLLGALLTLVVLVRLFAIMFG